MAVARFVLWSLADTGVSLDDVRAELPHDTNETWFADAHTERLGAFAVFADADAASEPLPRNLRELIGKDPDIVELFDVE
ncbi:MAG TPA: hypothetical protein VJP39_07715 [Gaiellaceae bacterium]|nr:hypothetical protein [Casimicrobiaceae bacterium]HKU59476.1 hypothetical protein [Gaiellaceae bacterium]